MISRTAEYALRAVLYFGGLPEGTTASASDAAAATSVPERYLARVLNTLAHAGLLRSTRGAHGGFQLAHQADTLTLGEVVAPFESVGGLPRCLLRDEPCGSGEACLAHSEWHAVASGVHGFFRRTTIADLLKSRPAGLAAAQTNSTLPDGETE